MTIDGEEILDIKMRVRKFSVRRLAIGYCV